MSNCSETFKVTTGDDYHGWFYNCDSIAIAVQLLHYYCDSFMTIAIVLRYYHGIVNSQENRSKPYLTGGVAPTIVNVCAMNKPI